MNPKALNPGAFIAVGLVTWVLWQFIGPWALIPAALAMLMHIGLYDDTVRKRNARKMRRELRMERRMGLAAQYVERHPDKA